MLYHDQVKDGIIIFELDEFTVENELKLNKIYDKFKLVNKYLVGAWEGAISRAFMLPARKDIMADIRASGLIDNQTCVLYCFPPNRQNKRDAVLAYNFGDVKNTKIEALPGQFQPTNNPDTMLGWTYDKAANVYFAVY